MSERQLQPTPERSDSKRGARRRLRIALQAVATILLFGLLLWQAGDAAKWVRPDSASEAVVLYALSTINFLAFVVLLMLLVRNIIKLRQERREMKLGAKFKTRLVTYFISLSLLPVIFLFFATGGLITRSVDKWFGGAQNQMVSEARDIAKDYSAGEQQGLARTATTVARLLSRTSAEEIQPTLTAECENQGLFMARLYDRDGQLVAERSQIQFESLSEEFRVKWRKAQADALRGADFSAQINQESEKTVSLIASAPVAGGRGALVIAQEVSPEVSEHIKTIDRSGGEYDTLRGKQRWVKNSAFLTLGLITLLVLFIAFWLALSVARSIADPVQQLAQATERIKSGDLTYRAGVIGDDELAALALSFNEMTAELSENRRRLEKSASELQSINAALDERRRYIETVMQSLSAGVISLDENRNVTMINEAARRLLRIERDSAAGGALESLLPEAHREELRKMILRASPLRPVTHEVHFTFADQSKLDAGVTVTALDDPRGLSRGAVIVIENLTELIEAQRRAAWSEVARRMAHEIKNPLTPIRLSAERMAKNLLDARGAGNGKSGHLNERQARLVRECTAMIDAEVTTLQRMVDEFSNFARLPKAAMETASLNEVVVNSLKLYADRLNGIRLTSQLAPQLPAVMIDCEQIKRALVNLIDNAAEAMAEAAGDRQITVITREVSERQGLELIVADTGPGIPPEDRERIFDPYFSTRKRGTGLGLAIVSRIVAEHQGRIRVQDNSPRGARFIIELPVAEQAVGAAVGQTLGFEK